MKEANERKDDAYVCPYYQRDKGAGRVYCECAAFKFPDLVARNEFVEMFCASSTGYKSCPLHGIMERYYYERKYKGM